MKIITTFFLGFSTLAFSLSAQSPFTPVPGQGDFRFHTDFTSVNAWDTDAGNFVTHPQAPTFRASGGGTIDTGGEGYLELQGGSGSGALFGSAKLDLTDPAILGEALSTTGEQPFAIYVRAEFVTNGALSIALGNEESWLAAPVHDDVRIVSGFVRTSSLLASWGQKRDFNNPSDGDGASAGPGTVPSFVAAGNTFDIAVLYSQGTVALFVKDTEASEWVSFSPPVELLETFTIGENPPGPGFLFDSPFLALYGPADNSTIRITDLAISEAASLPDNSFLTWWNSQDFDPQLEPDPLADNGDGLPYLLRHAWGLQATDPFDPSRQPLVQISDDDDDTYLTITFFIANEAASVTPQVGVSPDLENWDWEIALPVGDPIAVAEGTLLTFRDTVAISSADRRFMQVRYELTAD